MLKTRNCLLILLWFKFEDIIASFYKSKTMEINNPNCANLVKLLLLKHWWKSNAFLNLFRFWPCCVAVYIELSSVFETRNEKKVFYLIQISDPSGALLFHPGHCPTLVGQWHGEGRKLLAELRIRFFKASILFKCSVPGSLNNLSPSQLKKWYECQFAKLFKQQNHF